MNADDREYRPLTPSFRLPPELVSLLLEHGHTTVVADQAGRGEWFCALAWTRLLAERGCRNEAVKVLVPYAATGWWTAVVVMSELLESGGRVAEAIETIRARMALGHPDALEYYARLLARHGGAGEAFDLLLPHIGDFSLARALVDVSDAARSEEVAALLATRIDAHRCSDFPWCCGGFDTDSALGLIATVRERQGRVDEAIALLARRQHNGVVDGRLADLLARHGRIEELRTHAAGDGREVAVERLALVLEEHGDVPGAIEVARNANATFGLVQLLVRHGRGEEAIAVLRRRAEADPGDGRILHALAELCLDQGRPAEGMAHLDDLAALRDGEEEWDLYRLRLPLIAAHGGVDSAVAQARSHPEGDSREAASDIARLLAGAGRTEEAVTVLRQYESADRHTLAGHLVTLGRVVEALTLLQHTEPVPPLVPTTQLWGDGGRSGAGAVRAVRTR